MTILSDTEGPLRIVWTVDEARTLPEGGSELRQVFGVLEIDAVVSITIGKAAEPSSHPLETGEPACDHIAHAPDSISIEAWISNTPTFEIGGVFETQTVELDVGAGRRLARSANGAGQLAEWEAAQASTSSVRVMSALTEIDRVQDAFERLTELKEAGTVLDLENTGRGPLSGYVIAGFSDQTDPETGHAMHFGLELRHVRTVTLSEVDAPAPAVERGRRTSNQGREVAREVEHAPTGLRSWYAEAVDFAEGLRR